MHTNKKYNPNFEYQAERYIGAYSGCFVNTEMVPVDFNGDGNEDILVYQPSTGIFFKGYSNKIILPDLEWRLDF